jgi:hypothetical protein
MDRYEREAYWTGTRLFLALVAMGILMALGGYAWKYFMAPVAGKAEAEWQQESGANRTAQYDKFFDLCAAIQGYESTIRIQSEALKTATAPEDRSRLTTVVAGVRAQRGRAIAQYNADARKSYTQGRFLDGSLPTQLNDAAEQTQCVN